MSISKSQKYLNRNIIYFQNNKFENFETRPSPENLFVWYVKIKNLTDEYRGGMYFLKIEFPPNYPFAPPDYYMLTPSGKFDINTKICFSNSGWHASEWNPMWDIEQIIIGIISYFYEVSGGIAHLQTTPDVKRKFAQESQGYNSTHNNNILKLF